MEKNLKNIEKYKIITNLQNKIGRIGERHQ